MRRIRTLQLVLGMVAAAVSACQEQSPSIDPGEPVVSTSPVLARLNGEPIFEDEFRLFLGFTQGELNEDPRPAPRKELFQDFLNRKLLLQEAKKENITVEQSKVDAYVSEWTTSVQEVSPQLPEYVRDFLITQKFLHEKVRTDLKVTLREMLLYYEGHAEEFKVGDQAHVIEILTDDREEVESIRASLVNGDVRSFKNLARERSKGVTASLGGDLGLFERGDLPEEFEKAIFGLKPGEISAPFQSGHGFHLFFLEEWIPRHAQKFHEVRQEIFESLMARKERKAVADFLNQLMQNASVEIYEPSLALGSEENDLNGEING